MTHYIENIGDTDDVVFLEILQADHFSGKLLCHLDVFTHFWQNYSRYLRWTMAWVDTLSNRYGHLEPDRWNSGNCFQERRAVYCLRLDSISILEISGSIRVDGLAFSWALFGIFLSPDLKRFNIVWYGYFIFYKHVFIKFDDEHGLT